MAEGSTDNEKPSSATDGPATPEPTMEVELESVELGEPGGSVPPPPPRKRTLPPPLPRAEAAPISGPPPVPNPSSASKPTSNPPPVPKASAPSSPPPFRPIASSSPGSESAAASGSLASVAGEDSSTDTDAKPRADSTLDTLAQLEAELDLDLSIDDDEFTSVSDGPAVPKYDAGRRANPQAFNPFEPAGPVRSPTPAVSKAPKSGSDAASFLEEAQSLVRRWEAELADTPTPQRAARLHFEIARLSETPLADLRRATTHYEEAHKIEPEHLPTIRGARRVLVQRKSYQAALPLFDAEVRITSDPRAKAALYFAKARLLEDVMGSADEAQAAYATALELDRNDASVLKAVEQSQVRREDMRGVGRTLERSANAVSGDPVLRSSLVVQRAQLEVAEGNIETAIELFETALKLDPTSHQAREALKRLHHETRRWRALTRVLEMEAESTSDSRVRALSLYRIARLHSEQLGSHSEAISALERAYQHANGDPLVINELARVYELTEKWSSLSTILERLLELATDDERRAAILVRLARLSEERLNDVPAAIAWNEKVLELEGTNGAALRSLTKLYRDAEDWAALIRIRSSEAEATKDKGRRAEAYSEVADILEHRLNRSDQAAEYHARALGQVPGYPSSFKALLRLYSEAQRWRDLIELLERAIDLTDLTSRRVAYLNKIGSIYEDHLSEPVQAAQMYRRVLEHEETNLGAIHALQRATERAGRFEELVDALELERTHVDLSKGEDTQRSVSLLLRAASVLDERLKDRSGAVQKIQTALSLDANSAEALRLLAKIHYRAGRWEDLLDTNRKELELLERGPEKVELLHRMAEICQDRIGRDDRAVEHYRAALAIDSTHPATLRALSAKLEARNDHAALVSVREAELKILTHPGERARASFAIAQDYENQLNQADRAAQSYENALKARPDYRPALEALSRIRTQQKNWDQLVDDLERESSSTPDQGRKISALLRQGEIWASELNEPRRAIRCFERVLELDPKHIPALVALESLYRKVSAWPELARTYATQARVYRDQGGRVAALRELARLQETRSSAVDGDVIETYRAVLALDPADHFALEALERVAILRGDRTALAEADHRRSQAAPDGTVRGMYLARLAESLEAAGDLGGAITAFRGALTHDPENVGAIAGLSRLAERTNDPNAIAEATRREAKLTPDPKRAAELLTRGALVRLNRLKDMAGAEVDLARALELNPDDQAAAKHLTSVLLKKGEFSRLADVLSRAASSAETPDRIAALWMEVSNVQTLKLSNRPGAIGSLKRVLRTAPNHVPTLVRLAELYGDDSQWTESVNLLSKVVQLTKDRGELRDAHLSLAALWDDHLHDSARSLVSLQAVLAIDPKNAAALARLSDLQERSHKFDQAVDTANGLLAAAATDDDRAGAYLRIARLEEQRNRDSASEEALLKATSFEGPGSEGALQLKARMSSRGDWDRYAKAISEFLSRVVARNEDATPVYMELARVQLDQLRRPEAGLKVLRHGLTEGATVDRVCIRRELIRRLQDAGRQDEAIEEIHYLLADDLTSAETWRDLAACYQGLGKLPERRLALMPLVVLSSVSGPELETLTKSPPRPAHARSGEVDPAMLRRMGPTDAGSEAAGNLLGVITEGLGKIYPPDLEAYGLSSRDKLTTRGGHPLRIVADRIAEIVGVREFDLYMHRVRTRGVAVELTSPPAVLVPAHVADLPEAQQVFVVARPLIGIAQQLHALDKLTARELELSLASIAHQVHPSMDDSLGAGEYLEERGKQLHKALPRKVRKNLEEVVSAYVTAPTVDFSAWMSGVRRGTRRLASVLADDVNACVEVLQRGDRELGQLEGPELVRKSRATTDLLLYWVSPHALQLRGRLGMLGDDLVDPE